jgi:hypothetical protein
LVNTLLLNVCINILLGNKNWKIVHYRNLILREYVMEIMMNYISKYTFKLVIFLFVNSINMDVQLVPSCKRHSTVFTGIFNGSWEMNTFNMVLCLNFLSIYFCTKSALVLANVNAIYNLLNILKKNIPTSWNGKSLIKIFRIISNHLKNVMLLYIRVSVVLSQSLCRKEREKLDINLDSMVFVCRVKEI